MFRRRYLALAGATLVAGCQSSGEDSSPTETRTATATPTETETATPTETPTETDTETPEPTGAERTAALLEDAEAAVTRAYEEYLAQADGEADSLLAVGPETTGFEVGPVGSELDAARSHLDDASESASDRQGTSIFELRTAAEWLEGAAGVQAAQSRVAEGIDDAVAAGEAGEDYVAIRNGLDAALDRLLDVDTALAALDSPDRLSFGEVAAIDADEAVETYELFGSQQEGYREIRRRIDETGDAIGTLSSAQGSYNAESYDRAERLAGNAITHLEDIDADATEIEPESLDALVGRFRDALAALRERAAAIREDARAAQN